MAEDFRDILKHGQADLSKVGPAIAAEPNPGFWERAKDHFIDRVVPEVGEMLSQKMAQGAAELSMALNGEASGYTPYGYAQKPLEVEGPQQSWQEHLRDMSRNAGHEQEMER